MRKSHIDFVGKRKIWYIISIVLVIASLVSFFTRGMNLGIDFTGGNLFQLQFEQQVDSATLREVAQKYVEATPSIQASEGNVFLVRTTDMDEDTSAKFMAEVESTFGKTTVLNEQHIGPVIGKELISNAKWALILAVVLMLIYITIRFKFNYAVSAVVPLVHDVILTVGLFSILQVEIDTTFIAAILTILGYSINGTIVVFDRIRENTGMVKKHDMTHIINSSINQTLGRTINTVLAVLILVVCLFVFGGETTKSFALALIIGFVGGAYSSICIAGSILSDLFRINDKNQPEVATKKEKKITAVVK